MKPIAKMIISTNKTQNSVNKFNISEYDARSNITPMNNAKIVMKNVINLPTTDSTLLK